jgi:YbgC/YbaW family acyl-CoA thioester hydrolase
MPPSPDDLPGAAPAAAPDAPRPFVVQERVRWADVDLVGIMRFSAFPRLVELAEQELLRAAGLPFAEVFARPAVWMPRRHLAIDYFVPARLDDLLELETYVARLGETSLTLQVDVRSAARGTLLAAAAMVVVCVSVEDFGKRPLPGDFRARLGPWVLSVEAARAGRPGGAGSR